MTAEQVAQWKHERDLARSISDPSERSSAIQKVYDLRDDMMMHCIQRQADRIKTGLANDETMKADIATIKAEMKPLKETDREFREGKLKLKGAKMLWTALRYISTAVGGATLMKFLSSPS